MLRLTNITIIFLLWNVVFLLIIPSQVIGQSMMMNREGMKEMMKRMMPDQLPPGIDSKNLPAADSNGAKLLQRYCTQCHDLPSPRMHSSDEWLGVFQRMVFRMRRMSSSMMMRTQFPTPDEEETILAYLQSHSLQSADQNTIPHLDSPAGMLFQRACTQCHALPDPKQHTSLEWIGVVARMKLNMRKMGRPIINPKEEKQIVQFLQQTVQQ